MLIAITISLLLILVFVILFSNYLSWKRHNNNVCSAYHRAPLLEFNDFLKYYNTIADHRVWDLDKTDIKFNNHGSCYHILFTSWIDYLRYKSWYKNEIIQKRKKEQLNATKEMLNILKTYE